MAIKILKLLELRTELKSSHAIFLEGSTGRTTVQFRALALVSGVKLHTRYNSARTNLSEILKSIDMIIKHQLHFRTVSS